MYYLLILVGFGYSFRRKGRRSVIINLKDEIKPIMFPVSGPVCVSEDEERFKAVMTIFYQYEQSVSVCVFGGGGGGRCMCNRPCIRKLKRPMVP